MIIHLTHGCSVDFLVLWIPRFLPRAFNRRANSDCRPARLQREDAFNHNPTLRTQTWNAVWWKRDLPEEEEPPSARRGCRCRCRCRSVGTFPLRRAPGGAGHGSRRPARLGLGRSVAVTELDSNLAGFWDRGEFLERSRSGESGCCFLGGGCWSGASPVCHC